MASSYAPNFYGSSVSHPFTDSFQKNSGLTTAQARQLVAPTLADESSTFRDDLASINYHQRQNYAAYRSHRKHQHDKLRSAKRSRSKMS
jgi:hypothetical protein